MKLVCGDGVDYRIDHIAFYKVSDVEAGGET